MTDRRPTVGDGQKVTVPMMLDIHEMRRLLGNNLRSTREAARLSQKELAGICFVPDTSVSRVERGEQQPKLSTLALFSLAMGVPLTTSLLAGLDQWLLDL